MSAAEQAVALLLACARNIAPANASLKAGKWERSKWTGVEVADKTVGVVGLGRIGVLFAQRMSAFGVRLLAYDLWMLRASMNLAFTVRPVDRTEAARLRLNGLGRPADDLRRLRDSLRAELRDT